MPKNPTGINKNRLHRQEVLQQKCIDRNLINKQKQLSTYGNNKDQRNDCLRNGKLFHI